MMSRKIIMTLVFILSIISSTFVVHATTPLEARITKPINGELVLSNSLVVQMEFSGGNSTSYSNCIDFVRTEDIRYGIVSELLKDPEKIDFIQQYGNAKTIKISPTTLSCEFYIVPYAYFGYVWPFSTPSAVVQLNIYSGKQNIARKTLPITNEKEIQPAINILNPLRGADLSNDFLIKTEIINSGYWRVKDSYLELYEGNVSKCELPQSQRLDLNRAQQDNMRVDFSRSSKKQLIVTQKSDTEFRLQLFESGQYTICIIQGFISISNGLDFNGGNWVFAKQVINVQALETTLTYQYNDPIFNKTSAPYQVNLTCVDSVRTNQKSYKCIVGVKKKIESYQLMELFASTNVKVNLTGSVPIQVCEADSHIPMQIAICSEDDDSVSRFKKTYTIEVGIDKPVDLKVTNYLAKTGYTGVKIESQRGLSRANSYSWELPSYGAKLKAEANAPPSSKLQGLIENAVKKSMEAVCQKLPAGFNNLSLRYLKRVTSRDLVSGYLFATNKGINIAVYPMINRLYFGPSYSTYDEMKWRDWGCGGAIWT